VVDTESVDGKLRYTDERSVPASVDGVVTWTPAVGAIVTPGKPLLMIDNQPVMLMYGSLPLYRKLEPGVEQLRIAEGRNPQPGAGLIDSQTVKGADTVGRESRGQNVAIGLTGLPDVPAKRTGATARWKSHWPSSAAVVAHTSRSQLSSSHRPIATRLTA
jgi:hypothetical protein